MKIAIYGQFYPKNSEKPVQTLLEDLAGRDVTVHIEKQFKQAIEGHRDIPMTQDFSTFEALDTSYDLLISIGGDGTILRAVTYVRALGIPIVGINTGRLGFLATIREEDISDALDLILANNYRLSKRSLLQIQTDPSSPEFSDLNFALNEIAVSRKNTTSMITVETILDDEYLTSYWADGLIVSTPTGSTGYSLSCGGPVIMPEAENLVITPIAPHNLNARPLVISDDTQISLRVSGREENFLVSLDSRIATLQEETIVHIRKADFFIQMIELPDDSFLKTIRKKLLWGEDKRN